MQQNQRYTISGLLEDRPVSIEFAFLPQEGKAVVTATCPNSKEELGQWEQGSNAPSILPEALEAEEPGKVRDLEMQWAEAILAERLLGNFRSRLADLTSRVSFLETYDKSVFEDCKTFWQDFQEHAQSTQAPESIIRPIKAELDLLFDALKSLRKETAKERKEQQDKHRAFFHSLLDEMEADIAKEIRFKKQFSALKSGFEQFKKSDLKGSIQQNIKERFDRLFDTLKAHQSERKSGVRSKRVNDLTRISNNMKKSIDRDAKEIAINIKFRDKADHPFQAKLRQTKIDLLEKQMTEKKEKLANIEQTLKKLLKEEQNAKP